MKESIHQKMCVLRTRHSELGVKMTESDVVSDQALFRQYATEYAKLSPVVDAFTLYEAQAIALVEVQAMSEESDPELSALAKEEMALLNDQQALLIEQIQTLLLPEDPNDDRNIYLEIRAGTGGDEAAIFAGDLFRMYARYAENKKWQVEVVSQNEGEHGGYKEIVARVFGRHVYANLKFESGAHRVQRVPETESQGRIHTSACTVAVLPEVEAIDEVNIADADVRVDTFRASGAGGQHVNTTDSAVRMTHLPSGIVAECQDERSQHKNRAKALALLHARLLAHEQKKQSDAQAQTRRDLVGSGDRSERIRTYNFPQGRMTDHRIGLTLYKLDGIMQGELQQIIEPLIQEHQADQLAALGEQEGKDG